MNRQDILTLVNILRKITKWVKIAPFIYVALQLFVIVTNLFIDDSDTTWLDLTFYVSPLMIFFMWVFSRILRLCNWHRLQCSLPLFPLSTVVIDEYIYEVSLYGMIVFYVLVSTLTILSFINAYFIFIKPTNEKPNTKRS